VPIECRRFRNEKTPSADRHGRNSLRRRLALRQTLYPAEEPHIFIVRRFLQRLGPGNADVFQIVGTHARRDLPCAASNTCSKPFKNRPSGGGFVSPRANAHTSPTRGCRPCLSMRAIIEKRSVPALPPNDGQQMPFRGHPVFVAQHATETCCRSCLAKWHKIPRGRALTLGNSATSLRCWSTGLNRGRHSW
jgi:hypothetical protein